MILLHVNVPELLNRGFTDGRAYGADFFSVGCDQPGELIGAAYHEVLAPINQKIAGILTSWNNPVQDTGGDVCPLFRLKVEYMDRVINDPCPAVEIDPLPIRGEDQSAQIADNVLAVWRILANYNFARILPVGIHGPDSAIRPPYVAVTVWNRRANERHRLPVGRESGVRIQSGCGECLPLSVW